MKSPRPNPVPPTRFGEIGLPHLEAPNSDALGDWLRRMDAGAGLTGLATVKRLRAAGALIVGKTNTPEFGCTGATDNPLFGATVNAWNTAYSVGGSSGGSGAALAAGLVPLATGSDGGGSIRVPVSACGFPGFKPSTGRIPSSDANPPTGRTLSVRGPMAHHPRHLIALNVVKGDAATDIFALPDGPANWLAAWSVGTRPDRMIWAPAWASPTSMPTPAKFARQRSRACDTHA